MKTTEQMAEILKAGGEVRLPSLTIRPEDQNHPDLCRWQLVEQWPDGPELILSYVSREAASKAMTSRSEVLASIAAKALEMADLSPFTFKPTANILNKI